MPDRVHVQCGKSAVYAVRAKGSVRCAVSGVQALCVPFVLLLCAVEYEHRAACTPTLPSFLLTVYLKLLHSLFMRVFYVLLAFIATFVVGDVDLTAPEEGATFTASGSSVSVEIKWKDSADDSDSAASLSKVLSYTILLCYGAEDGSGTIKCLDDDPLLKAQKISGMSYTALIDANQVPNGYYYFQVYAAYAQQGYSIHYSERFQLKGMSGPSTIKATATGDTPGPQVSIEGVDGAGGAINSKSFSITYTLQTGKTRYAPMQMQPGSTITHSKYSTRYPTSAVTYYSTKAKTPVVMSTITPGWSYSVKSFTNLASAQSFETSHYAASAKVTQATLSAGHKRKRWID